MAEPIGPQEEGRRRGPRPEKSEDEEARPRKRVSVPQDEGLLLRRDPTFTYGISLGVTYSFVSVDFTQETLTGIGYSVGANAGFFLAHDMVLRFLAAYSMHSAAGSLANSTVGFGLLDLGAIIDWTLDKIALQAGLQLSTGVNLRNLPRNTAIQTSADASSLWAIVGVGYEIPTAHYVSLVPTVRYGLSFNQSPVGFQAVWVLLALNFKG